MPTVTVYSRPNCGLCDELKQQLEALRADAEFEWREVDIDQDADLRRRYNDAVPVVAVDGVEVCRHRLNASKFLESLRRIP